MNWTISRKIAKRFLDELKEEIESKSPAVKIVYSNDKENLLGKTVENEDGTVTIYLYTENFDTLEIEEPYIAANVKLFSTAIVRLLYECRQLQKQGKYKVEIPHSSNNMISNYLAKHIQEWVDYPSDVESELFALTETHRLLENAFPYHGEYLTLAYANYRIIKDLELRKIGNGIEYYIHRKYEVFFLDDIYKDCRKMYKKKD